MASASNGGPNTNHSDDFNANPRVFNNIPRDVEESEMLQALDKRDDVSQGSNSVFKPDSEGAESTIIEVKLLPEDTYALLATAPFGRSSFLFALFVCVTQVCSWFFLIDSFIDREDKKNPLGVPADVEPHVRLIGFLGVLVAVFSQDDIVQSFNCLYNGFQIQPFRDTFGQRKFQFLRWTVSLILRTGQGSMGLLTVLLIVVRASNVVDMLLSFAAGEFISFIDDVAFSLMKYGYSGPKAKSDTHRIQDATFVPQKRFLFGRRIDRFPRTVVIMTLVMICVSGWSYITWMQLNGKFMCDSLYIQFSDEVRPELSYFFGFYDINISKKKDSKVTYWERRALDLKSTRPSLFRFCADDKVWALVISGDPDECGNAFAKTDSVEENALFDFEAAATDTTWSVSDTVWSRDLPVSSFSVSCSTNDDFPLADSNFPNPCSSIRLNELYSGFNGARPWPDSYKMLTHESSNVKVYDRPVFVSEPTPEGDTDIIMYLGARWGLTSTVLMRDYKGNDPSSLAKYLKDSFHAFTSDYTLAFLSSEVKIASTSDNPTPIGLNWFQASQKQDGGFQSANSNVGSSAVFICKICSAKNQCFFGGNCTSSGSCDCINGGSGTLCQISPEADGHCDSFFNTPEFNYDGGDCCSHTCVSKSFECGKDKTGYLEVGFDLCHLDSNASSCPNCWEKNGLDAFGDTNSALSGTSVSLTSSGRVLGVGDPGINTVRILDKKGSGWKLRGSLLTGPEDSSFGSVVTIAGPNKAVGNPVKKIPLTVAASGKGFFKVYDWDEDSLEWKDISPTVSYNNLVVKEVPNLGLYNTGYVFGALIANKLHLWEREMFAATFPGKEIWKNKDVSGSFVDFSMSDNGSRLFTAVKDQALVKITEMKDMSEAVVKISNSALVIQSSSTGDLFATLVNYMKGNGEVWVYKKSSDGKFSTSFFKNKSIRGIPLHADKTTMLGITDDGLTVSVSYPSLGKVYTFLWNTVKSIWEESGKPLTGSSLSILSDGSALAVGEEGNDETGPDRGKTVYYVREGKTSCNNNSVKYHITMTLDDQPIETLWQLQTQSGGSGMLQEGPYISKQISVSDEICIPKSTCMNIVLFDTRGDGLRNPGFVGISSLGMDRFNTSQRFGFEKVINIPGVTPCSRLDRPWTELPLHKRCRDKACNWNQKGSDLDGKKEFDGSGKTISLSGDGKRVAIGAEFHDGAAGNITSAGHVRVFEYDDDKNDWNQIGQDIHGTQRFEYFGYFVSLSADGSTLGVGAPQNNQTGNETGAARVYKFEGKEWEKIGNDLIGKGQFDRFGESISVSDDGSKVIVGAIKNDDNGKDSGHAQVFQYNQITLVWDQLGQDIVGESPKDFSGILVDISGNGTIVAVGADFNDGSEIKSGHVRVHEYNAEKNEWKLLGKDIDGESGGDLFGGALSLSKDGKTIAIGATVNSGNGENSGHVRVFDYVDEKNDWVQKGQDIDGESMGDNSGVSVSLSRHGNIVAIGAKRNDGSAVDSGHTRVYQYVDRIKMWHQIGYDIDGVAKGDFFGRSVSLSAEGDIVAIGSPDHDDVKGTSFGHVRVFQFLPVLPDTGTNLGDPVCETNEIPFRLEFEMDLFAKDIAWGIFNEKGDQIVFENFAESKKKYANGERATRRECLPIKEDNDPVPVALLITDQYGDGLCCNWGKGSFSVFYDTTLISDSMSFQDVRTLCLPKNQSYTPISIDLTLDSSPVQTWWILHDSTREKEITRSQTNYQGYDPYSNIKQALCVEENHCLSYIIGDNNVDDKGFNGLGVGAGYALSLGGQYLKPKTGEFEATDIVRFGKNCAIPAGKSLVQIVFYAGFIARDVSWQLVSIDNSKESILDYGGNYNVTFSGHFHETLVPKDSCLTFRMRSGTDASFTIRIDENITHHEHRGFNPLSIVRFGSCSQCEDGKKLAQILMFKKSTRNAFWQLNDSAGKTLADGGEYGDDQSKIFYEEYCAPADECLSLNIFGQGDVMYELIWDGKLVKYNTPLTTDIVKFGACNGCNSDQTLFQIELNTGWQPAKLSWKVVNKLGAIIFEKKENSYPQDYQFKHEYYDRCMPTNDCLNVTIDDLCAEACLKYRILWNDTLVEEGSTSFEKKPFLRVGGNCT